MLEISSQGPTWRSTQQPLPWHGHCPQPCPLCRESCFCGDDPSRGVEVGLTSYLSGIQVGDDSAGHEPVLHRDDLESLLSEVTRHPAPSSPFSTASEAVSTPVPGPWHSMGPHCQMALAPPCTNKPEGARSCLLPSLPGGPRPGT